MSSRGQRGRGRSGGNNSKRGSRGAPPPPFRGAPPPPFRGAHPPPFRGAHPPPFRGAKPSFDGIFPPPLNLMNFGAQNAGWCSVQPPHPVRSSRSNRSPPRGGDSSSGKFLDLADVVRMLCETPHHSLPAETITSELGSSAHALKCVTDRFKHILTSSSTSRGLTIELNPQVKLCQDYIKSSGCTSSTHCKKLHICHEYTYGSCSDFDCDFGHRWTTTHNHNVWAYFFLGDVDELVLESIMRKHRRQHVAVSVCKPYNDGDCPKVRNCKHLHICQKLIQGAGACDTQRCLLNHDILSTQCSIVLNNCGINTNDSRRDLLASVQKSVNNVHGCRVRHEKAKTKLLDCFQNLHEQEEKVRSIVSCMLARPYFYCTLELLSELINLSVDALDKLIQHYYFLFVIYPRQSMLKLQPRLALCHFYSSTQKCRNNASCNFLHLCGDFFKGTCQNDANCNAQHSLSEQPNASLLKQNFLDHAPLDLLLPYFQVRFRANSTPFVCFPYNEEGCLVDDCKDLHICYDFLFTQAPCSSSCSKNHDLYSSDNLRLLAKDALNNLLPGELLPLLSARVSHRPKQTTTNASFSRGRGDVLQEEVCVDHLSTGCSLGSKCPKVHSPGGALWQFCKDGIWFNFMKAHSDRVEASYRDCNKGSVKLGACIYDRTTEEKKHLACMNIENLVVNFETMCLTSESNKFKLITKRLSTPSSAESSSDFATVYGWYFMDKNGAWIEYGRPDSSTGKKHSTKQSSLDIEIPYLKEPQGRVNLNGIRFNYTLNFATMEQTNDTTGVVRKIQRRPKYLVAEKTLGIDAYNLKLDERPRNSASIGSMDIIGHPASASNVSQANELPSYWEKMQGGGPELFLVNLASNESIALMALILNTIPSAEVTGIRRLQNTYHYYALRNHVQLVKAQEKKDNVIVQRLFHGTREVHLDKISQHNLEWRQDFADTGRKFGRGAYFFNNAQLAYQFASALQTEDTSSPVVLVIADVYVGTIAQGTPDMIRPPLRDDGRLHDTTVNSVSVPSVFVKYNPKEYCPLYFVTIKPSA